MSLFKDPFFVRNMIYGIEDSLISTSGVVVGMSLAGIDNSTIWTTGVILVLVEALSMAFGTFVSEDSFMTQTKVRYTWKDVIKYSMVMLLSYIIAGAIPLTPFGLGMEHAWQWTVGSTLVGLFALMYAYKRAVYQAALLTTVAATILTITIVTSRYV